MAKPQLYYQLVDTLKQLSDAGEDVKKVTEHALRQIQKRVYSYDRTAALKVISIEFEDRYGDTAPAILRALHFLKWCGDVGTSQSLRTNMSDQAFLHFDGDGAAQIKDIKLDGEEVKVSKEDIGIFEKVTR